MPPRPREFPRKYPSFSIGISLSDKTVKNQLDLLSIATTVKYELQNSYIIND